MKRAVQASVPSLLPFGDRANGTGLRAGDRAIDPASGHARRRPAVANVSIVFAVFAVLVVAYAPTAWSMVRTWLASDTYVHGFLAPAVFVWYAWQRRGELAHLPLRPFFPATVLLAIASLLWLVGELAGMLVVSQFALVAMLPCAIAAVGGWRWLHALAFPAAFLFFAVPFGEALVPQLMEWTADFTVAALLLSGVPVYREGLDFIVPTGHWSVVEACSGVRYLMAMLTVGCLYAWVMFRSPWRRGMFMVACVATAVAANWLRAYGIVMLGHMTSNRLAVGVDHLIYGWVFFAIVLAVMFAIGARWRDADTPAAAPTAVDAAPVHAPAGPRRGERYRLAVALLLVVAVIGGGRVAGLAQQRDAQAVRSVRVVPMQTPSGWREVHGTVPQWQPALAGAAAELALTFENAGARVGVHIALFRDQRQGAELVSAEHQLFATGVPGRRARPMGVVRDVAEGIDARAAVVVGHGERRLIWQWYWVDGAASTSDIEAKLRLALDRLVGRDDTSAWVAVHTDADPEAAEAVLRDFLKSAAAPLAAALHATKRGATR